MIPVPAVVVRSSNNATDGRFRNLLNSIVNGLREAIFLFRYLRHKKNVMNIASFIDHTLLKPTASKEDVRQLCTEAEEYGFAAVCVPPYHIRTAVEALGESNVKIATVVGFPFGYSHYKAKETEVEKAIADQVNEVDMVINLAALKDENAAYLKEEISSVASVCTRNSIVLKLIIESGILTDQEIIRCCEFYKEFDVDFLKTSTGYGDKGASVEAVRIMRQHLPAHIQIKASGGIKSFDFANALIEAGATRLGCSASVSIVKGGSTNAAY